MTLPSGRRPKFGDIDNRPFPRRDIVHREFSDNWSRLEIATAGSPVQLMLDCARFWPPPYFVLYVELEGLADYEAGRYQSPRIDKFEDLRSFLLRFQAFFEGDARHTLWVDAPREHQMVIYDPHEILYLYGDDGRVLAMLEARGFDAARPEVPAPHRHNFDHDFTSTLHELMDFWDWHRTPLQPGDRA